MRLMFVLAEESVHLQIIAHVLKVLLTKIVNTQSASVFHPTRQLFVLVEVFAQLQMFVFAVIGTLEICVNTLHALELQTMSQQFVQHMEIAQVLIFAHVNRDSHMKNANIIFVMELLRMKHQQFVLGRDLVLE